MYFCRRGRENQREMTVDMFEFQADEKGTSIINVAAFAERYA